MLKGKSLPSLLSLRKQSSVIGGGRKWELSDSDSEEEQAGKLKLVLPEYGDMNSKSWAERNSLMQANTRTFVMTMPGPILIITLITMQLTIKALQIIESQSSEDWDKAQWSKFAKTGRCTSRMAVAYSGTFEKELLPIAGNLMNDASTWEAVPPGARTWSSAGLAFVLISTALCGLEALSFSKFRGYPCKLWSLLEDRTRALALEILSDPSCMKDSWSLWFLSIYDTVDKLLGEGAILLAVLGFLLRLEICRIECRNAAIRRLMRSKDSTYCPLIGNTSADFTLLRQRLLERLFTPEPEAPEEPKKVPVVRVRRTGKFKGCKTGGGGAARRHVGTMLKGQKFPSKEARSRIFKKVMQSYNLIKRQSGPAWTRLQQEGAVGTISHRAGRPAFRATLRKKRPDLAVPSSSAACVLPPLLQETARGIAASAELALVQQACTKKSEDEASPL